MKLVVDRSQRYAKMRAHTATHLLHAALDKILNWTKQAGSFVDEDYLRFDFTAKWPLSQQQIRQIEDMVNGWIYEALDIEIKEMSFDEAIKLWAKAFFEDKYWDIVRVVIVKGKNSEKMLKNSEERDFFISIELCWGTHVSNTSQIWAFKIIWQEAVASWIRRIVALTWVKVAKFTQEQEDYLNRLADKLWATSKQLEDKINKLLKEIEELKSENEKLKNTILTQEIKKLIEEAKNNEIFDKILIIWSDSVLNEFNFKQIVNLIKNLYWNENFLVYNQQWNFAINFWRKNLNARQFLEEKGLKGGGSDVFVQGRDEKIRKII